MTTLIIIELDTIPEKTLRSWIKKKNWRQNWGIRRFQFRKYKWFPEHYKKKQLKILSKYNYKYTVIRRSQWEAEKKKCLEDFSSVFYIDCVPRKRIYFITVMNTMHEPVEVPKTKIMPLPILRRIDTDEIMFEVGDAKSDLNYIIDSKYVFKPTRKFIKRLNRALE